jgi:tRNA-dihydrouridine synthase B
MLAAASTSPGPARSGLAALGPLHVGPHRVERPIVLAPMAGVSEAPFRRLALALGAGLAPTELVSARGLELGSARTEVYLAHDPAAEPLLSVQLFGGDPASMARAAAIAAGRGARILDVNMGCPVPKVTRGGAGSALMADPARAAAIVEAMRRAVGDTVPVTAKLRAGLDAASVTAVEVARRLEDAGVAALALHPRTRAQGYGGRADWDLIGAVAAAVRVPVIANGDIETVTDADRVVASTGCAAVMIGRAALGDPWVFERLAAAWAGRAPPPPPTPPERARFVLAHLAAHLEHAVATDVPGRRRGGTREASAVARGVRRFRPHVSWYTRGLVGAEAFRAAALRIDDAAALEAALHQFLSTAEQAGPGEAAAYDERLAFG